MNRFLELLSASFTITDEAKLRTSQGNRAIVLKLCALLLEPANPLSPFDQPPLLVEDSHADQSFATIYDPTAGVRIVPTLDFLPYKLTGILFKRSSRA